MDKLNSPYQAIIDEDQRWEEYRKYLIKNSTEKDEWEFDRVVLSWDAEMWSWIRTFYFQKGWSSEEIANEITKWGDDRSSSSCDYEEKEMENT
jgi:hypothetical protein